MSVDFENMNIWNAENDRKWDPLRVLFEAFIANLNALNDWKIDSNWYDTWRITPTMLNWRVNYSSQRASAQYKRIWGVVYIKWLIKGGTTWVVFNLPTWFRPAKWSIHLWQTEIGNSSYRFDVLENWNLALWLIWSSTNRFSIECSFAL